ncbi:12556_t:CDS:2, partial [Acaulospora colombiana]
MYYIKHQIIPPLERIFNLVGADVSAWFDEMPKPQRIEGSVTDKKPSNPNIVETSYRSLGKKTNQNQKIDTHFGSNTCLVCEATTMEGEPIRCESLECEWLYERVKSQKEVEKWGLVPQLLNEVEQRLIVEEAEEEILLDVVLKEHSALTHVLPMTRCISYLATSLMNCISAIRAHILFVSEEFEQICPQFVIRRSTTRVRYFWRLPIDKSHCPNENCSGRHTTNARYYGGYGGGGRTRIGHAGSTEKKSIPKTRANSLSNIESNGQFNARDICAGIPPVNQSFRVAFVYM